MLAMASGARGACEIPTASDPGTDDEFECAAPGQPSDPPPPGPPTIVAWAGGFDVNPFDGELRGGIFVARASGEARRKIVTFSHLNRDRGVHGFTFPDDHPSFSPDNRKIVFTSNRLNRSDWDIHVMNPNGSGVTPLARAAGLDTEPVFSPDGTKIAFATERSGGDLDIAVMNANGTGVQILTRSSFDEVEPAWRPDGQEIAFTRIQGGNEKDVFVMSPDGTGVRQITAVPGEDHDATYSPNGQEMVITSERPPFSPPYGNVYRIRASDGAALADLTPDIEFGAGDPFWQRGGSGTLIAYFKSFGPNLDSPQRLFLMNVGTPSNTRSLVPSEVPVNLHPAIGVGVDSNADGVPDYLNSGSVGRARLSPRRARVRRTTVLRFSWTHPQAWRLMETISIRLSQQRRLLGAVRHVTGSDSLGVFDSRTNTFSRLRRIGRGVLRSRLLSLDLRRSRIVAVTKRTLRLELAVRFTPEFGDQTLRVRVQADDRRGRNQDEELATIAIRR